MPKSLPANLVWRSSKLAPHVSVGNRMPRQRLPSQSLAFLGACNRVKRSVTAGSVEHAAAAAAKKKGGLDNVLAAIDGPKSISTVSIGCFAFRWSDPLTTTVVLHQRGDRIGAVRNLV